MIYEQFNAAACSDNRLYCFVFSCFSQQVGLHPQTDIDRLLYKMAKIVEFYELTIHRISAAWTCHVGFLTAGWALTTLTLSGPHLIFLLDFISCSKHLASCESHTADGLGKRTCINSGQTHDVNSATKLPHQNKATSCLHAERHLFPNNSSGAVIFRTVQFYWRHCI